MLGRYAAAAAAGALHRPLLASVAYIIGCNAGNTTLSLPVKLNTVLMRRTVMIVCVGSELWTGHL